MITKNCKECGQEFIPASNRQMYCNRDHWRKCPSCGKMYLEKYHENLSKPPRLCTPTCGQKHKEYVLPEFTVIENIQDCVIIDSTIYRSKYDNYNISKYFQEKNIRCVHRFPEDKIDRLLESLDIYKTEDVSEFKVYKLNTEYAEEFLIDNDTRPYYNPTSLALGLVKNYEIYQVITFASPRYNHKYDAEIIRCCSKLHTKIAGGLDLLSSSASIYFGITSCIAYQDLSKNFSTSELEHIGMRLEHKNVPRLRSSGVYDCGTAVMVF